MLGLKDVLISLRVAEVEPGGFQDQGLEDKPDGPYAKPGDKNSPVYNEAVAWALEEWLDPR